MDLLNFKISEECAGIALVNGGRIFLIRPFFDFRVQRYAIPKGHVETGEAPQDCARREFAEETGIDLSDRPLEFLTYVTTRIGNDRVKRVIVYRVDGDGSERFKGANLSPSGSPENIYGEYVDYRIAREIMTGYQIPIVTRLMKNDTHSFGRFYERFMSDVGRR